MEKVALLLLATSVLVCAFVLFVVGIGTAAWILHSWIRAQGARKVGASFPPIKE